MSGKVCIKDGVFSIRRVYKREGFGNFGIKKSFWRTDFYIISKDYPIKSLEYFLDRKVKFKTYNLESSIELHATICDYDRILREIKLDRIIEKKNPN